MLVNLLQKNVGKQLVNKPYLKTNICKLSANKLYRKDLYSRRFVHELSTKFTKLVYVNELVNDLKFPKYKYTKVILHRLHNSLHLKN